MMVLRYGVGAYQPTVTKPIPTLTKSASTRGKLHDRPLEGAV